MSRSVFSFGRLAPPKRRFRARRRTSFAALEVLDARLLLSAASTDNPVVSAGGAEAAPPRPPQPRQQLRQPLLTDTSLRSTPIPPWAP